MRSNDIHKLVATAVAEAFDPENLRAALRVAELIKAGDDAELDAAEITASEAVLMPRRIARHGGIFVLNEEDYPALGAVELDDGELPPLPFELCWFEVWSESEAAPLPIFHTEDGDIVAFGVWENTGSADWTIYAVTAEEKEVSVRIWHLAPVDQNGVRVIGIKQPAAANEAQMRLSPEAQSAVQLVQTMPIRMAHLVNVLGAKMEEVPQPRARRREYQRSGSLAPPTVYLVNLRATGDSMDSEETGITYQHRWLVRGHYRANPSGTHQVPGKGRCSWVRPYVKGPLGAPWKGRPIHHTGTTGT